MYKTSVSLAAVILVIFVQPTPAPVPRCSPWLIINKLVESNSWTSDSNPYFPVPPCEYGGPKEALNAGDHKAVFVLAEPEKIPRHNFYEFVWFLKTGLPRALRMMAGGENFIFDKGILKEGYKKHSTPYVRTHPLGRPTIRNPTIIDDKYLYDRIVKGKIRDLIRNGPDTRTNNHYTYQGNLLAASGGGGGGYGGGNSHHRTGYQGGFVADARARDDTASSRPTKIEKFELSNAIKAQ